MNGKVAKKLRRIARELHLDPENKYAPVGEIVHRPAIKDHGRSYTAGIVPRPFALQVCERRAYLEAKAIYKNSCQPIAEEQRRPHDTGTKVMILPPDPVAPFKARLHSSIAEQPEGPV